MKVIQNVTFVNVYSQTPHEINPQERTNKAQTRKRTKPQKP